FRISYKHLEGGRLRVIDPGERAHEVQVLGGGLLRRSMGNGTTEVAQFDAAGRCLFKLRRPPQEFGRPCSQVYVYSPEGDLRRIEDSRRGTTEYTYDPAHRLTGEFLGSGERRRYCHDDAGNLLEKPGLKGVAVGDGNRLAHANGARFAYDSRN